MTELGEFFARYPRCALAFSGGTDSALLLYEARRLGADVRAYFVRGPFQPRFELEDARRLAAELGAELSVLELDVLSLPEVAKNGPDRCYHCKRAIFSAIARRAAADGYGVVIDGTNASDRSDDRPGMRAMGELGVLSPLRMCGISKRRVRELSRLHRRYDRAILAGDLSAASLAADEVEGYERVWGLRLLAAPSVAQMRRAIAGASEGDAYGA